MNNHYLIHLPHSGTSIPEQFRGDYLISDDELTQNIDEFTDSYLDDLFCDMIKEFGSVQNNYSRLFFDPERFFDDSKEEMHLHYKLGWFYENTPLEEKALRTIKNKDEISKYYIKHHKELYIQTKQKLQDHNKCTVIDCHSFSNTKYWFKKQTLSLPDIYIDYNPSSKDHVLIDTILEEFKNYHVIINAHLHRPVIPNDYYESKSNIKAVVIKFNKKLYLEDDNKTKSNNFEILKNKINNIFEKIKNNTDGASANNDLQVNQSKHLLDLY